jgi:hypothetical protein
LFDAASSPKGVIGLLRWRKLRASISKKFKGQRKQRCLTGQAANRRTFFAAA